MDFIIQAHWHFAILFWQLTKTAKLKLCQAESVVYTLQRKERERRSVAAILNKAFRN